MNPKIFPFLLNNLEKEAEMNIDSLSVTYEAYMYMHIHMHLCVCVCVCVCITSHSGLLRKGMYYYFHYTDKTTKAQRGKIICPRSNSK